MDEVKIFEFRQRQGPMGAQHGLVCATVAYELKKYLSENPVGQCFGAGTGFLVHIAPQRIVALDAAVVRRQRITGEIGLGPFAGAPDLAVLVIAPSDKFDEVEADIKDLMAAGTAHVWILRPRVRMVTVHHSPTDISIIGESEELTAEDVLPGFRLPVARLFAE